jgi:hypothetical protein
MHFSIMIRCACSMGHVWRCEDDVHSHDLGHGGRTGIPSRCYHPLQNVPLGKDAVNPRALAHQQATDTVLVHQFSSGLNRGFRLDSEHLITLVCQ